MKKTISLTLVSASLAVCSYAAPFMAIGDGAELFLTGTLGIRADDNIFLSRNAESDVIFDINPGVDITFGKDAQMKGALTLSDNFTNYSDNSDQNTQLFQADFWTRYDDGKLKLGFNVGYHELNQNSVDVRSNGVLIRRDIFTAGGSTEVEISQLSSVGAGVNFTHENYKRVGFSDTDTLTVPLDFYWKYTPKMDVSIGYRYRDTKVDIGEDSSDHFFNIGARGEFSPKFTGKVAVGWTKRKLDVSGDRDLFGIDSSFAYEIDAKTNLQFGVSNDFGTSPQGAQQKNFVINGMIVTKISEEWSVNAGLSWRNIAYSRVNRFVGPHEDDFWEAQLGTAYIVNANIRLVGGYTYRKYNSDFAANEFKNNVFSFAANFRY
jgi:hypothetical protein